jgi:ribonuclease BN (tRNA processing enzyme)
MHPKLTFLGTRGYIKPSSKQHRMETSLLITYKRQRIMIDCGESWESKFTALSPHHIILTHAHEDHAFGLKGGTPCPVWGTRETWKKIAHFPIEKDKRHILKRNVPTKIGGVTFIAYSVIHSHLAPAVGFRIQIEKTIFFYVPDVAWIPRRCRALNGALFYIGDGATITRNMIRKTKDTGEIFGHATIKEQLRWCQTCKVTKMIITHCGSDIVAHPEREVKKKIQALAEKQGIEVEIAYDGMELNL